jgi:hypothetical protein
MRQLSLEFADFTVTCPDQAAANSPVFDIRARGNVPLVLEEDMVIELKRSELLENWRSTCAMGRARVDRLVYETARRIQAALDDEEMIDLPSLATDTAAFYVLALRQKGVKHPCNMANCAVRYYHDETGAEHGEVVIN